MTEENSSSAPAPNVPDPVDGKHVFPIDKITRVRFNPDGWVEEINAAGGPHDPPGTKLQGKPESKLDDIYARRYYDLYSRVVILDIHPKRQTDQSGASGLVHFKDLEPGSPMYVRVNKIIQIANHHFKANLKELA